MIQTITTANNYADDYVNKKQASASNRRRTGASGSSSYVKYGDLERQNKNKTQSQQKQMGKVLEGVVVNNFIKDESKSSIDIDNLNIDDICNTLVIPDTFSKNPVLNSGASDNDKTFEEEKSSMLKSALPIAAITVGVIGGALGLTALFKKSASSLNSKNLTRGEKLPLLGMNMNIREEHEFAAYMALRNPNKKTILAMIGVFLVSGITLIGKNFIDAIKDIWVKKREADANKYLQESLINIETRAFAGKLDVVREELVNKANYFKEALDSIDDSSLENSNNDKDKNPFLNFFGYKKDMGFKGSLGNKTNKDEGKSSENRKDSALPLLLFGAGTILAGIFMGRKIFRNFQDADFELRKYVQNETKNIDKKVSKLAKRIEGKSSYADAAGDLDEIKRLLQIKRADSIEVDNIYSRFKFLNKKDLENTKMEIMTGIKSIYGDAPETMGGKVGQIQYYCYLDETRGHMYNWIMNPENPFAGYLFMTLALVNSIGYSIKTAVEGIQEAGVNFENKKTEKKLQERLIDTEIRNFKSKKLSAIEPMMRDFNLKLNSGASKEELKTIAENILLEIKNGPPFVYA